MNDKPMTTTTMPATMTDEEILAWQQEQDQKRADARRRAKIEHARLAFEWTRTLGGPEGSAFFIHDTGDLGEGMFVVKLGDTLRLKAFMDVDNPTDSDRYDLLEGCVVHPAKEQFQTICNRRPALYIELSNRLAKLYGLKLRTDEGK